MKSAKFINMALMLLCISILTACPGGDEDPDPREIFLGIFEMKETEGNVLFTSQQGNNQIPFSFQTNNNINISVEEGTTDKIALDLNEFSNEFFQSLFSQSAVQSVSILDNPTATVSGRTFEFDKFHLIVTLLTDNGPLTYDFECAGTGDVDENDNLDLNFKMSFFAQSSTIVITGKSNGRSLYAF